MISSGISFSRESRFDPAGLFPVDDSLLGGPIDRAGSRLETGRSLQRIFLGSYSFHRSVNRRLQPAVPLAGLFRCLHPLCGGFVLGQSGLLFPEFE